MPIRDPQSDRQRRPSTCLLDFAKRLPVQGQQFESVREIGGGLRDGHGVSWMGDQPRSCSGVAALQPAGRSGAGHCFVSPATTATVPDADGTSRRKDPSCFRNSLARPVRKGTTISVAVSAR